jgi:hypothetical protein
MQKFCARTILVGGLVAFVLVASVLGCHGSGGLGATCKGNSDCKAAHECVEEQCTRECKNDAECSDVADFQCGKVSVTRSKVGIRMSGYDRAMCVPYLPLDHTMEDLQASVAEMQASAAAERESAMKQVGDDLSSVLKASTVELQVGLHCNALRKEHPSHEAFEQAWNALPAEHRKTTSDDELARELVPQLLKSTKPIRKR